MAATGPKPRLAVALLGHRGHGKTTLLAALLDVLDKEVPGAVARAWTTDALDAVGRSGWHAHRVKYGAGTVEPRFVTAESPARVLDLVDCPGLRRRVDHLPWALHGVDAVVLVVDSGASVGTQTREHLLVARALGIDSVVVFLSKCDTADGEELIDIAELEVRELLTESGFAGDDVPVVRGAAAPALGESASGQATAWRASIRALIGLLERASVAVREGDGDGAVEISIQRAYRARRGLSAFDGEGLYEAIVTGVVDRGVLRPPAVLTLVGFYEQRDVRVRGIQIADVQAPVARAGDPVGLRVQFMGRGLALAEGVPPPGWRPLPFRRGQRLIARGAVGFTPRRGYRARVTVLERERGGRHTPLVGAHDYQLHVGTAAVPATVRPVDELLLPGETGEVHVELRYPLLIPLGAAFVLRNGSDGLRLRDGGPPAWGGLEGWGTILRPHDHQATAR